MSVNRKIHFFDGEFVLSGDSDFVEYLRRMRPDDVRSEDLAVLGVSNDLHESLRLA